MSSMGQEVLRLILLSGSDEILDQNWNLNQRPVRKTYSVLKIDKSLDKHNIVNEVI